MISENEIDQIIENLIKHQHIEMKIDGEIVVFRFSEGFKKIEISSSVFNGDNYIPKSIRRGINAPSVFPYSFIKTYFTVDERKFQVILNFTRILDNGFSDFESWLKEFLWLAKEWRHIIEDHGREDLLFVYVNKK